VTADGDADVALERSAAVGAVMGICAVGDSDEMGRCEMARSADVVVMSAPESHTANKTAAMAVDVSCDWATTASDDAEDDET